jgi:uncharacterized membrane protein YccC
VALPAPRFDLRLGRPAIVAALALIVAIGAVLAPLALLIGPNTAQSAFVTIMLLLSPLRAAQSSTRFAAAGLAVAVALSGFLLGPLGPVAIFPALIAVSLAQALFWLGDVATMTRAPVNLLAFAALATTGAELWQVVLGTLIGAAFTLLLARLLPPSDVPPTTGTARERLLDGVILAVGAVIIVALGEVLSFPFTGWALLSFAMIVTVGGDRRTARSLDRVAGTIVGTVVATLVSFAEAPWPLVAAALCGLLSVAYLRQGSYAVFVTFLTPAVLLTSTTDLDPFQLGLGRIEAVVAAAVIAVTLTVAGEALRRRREARG